MSENQLSAYKFARSLSELSAVNSELSAASQFLDPNSYIEVRYSDGGQEWSGKTTLSAIDQTVITTYHLYNNLNDIFNPLKHPNETYFPSSTVFSYRWNPFVHKENNKPNSNEATLFDSLNDNNLVTKQAVDDYLRNTGICVPVCSPDSNYVYYVPEEHLWRVDNSKKPIVMDYHKDGIWTSESKLTFHYGSNYYYFTDEVVSPKNIMLNVTGNIVLNSSYTQEWYEKQHYFVGLTLAGKIATFIFLKNILKIENTEREGEFFTVAQFHFLCPLAKGTRFRIITNANCRLFGMSEKDQYSRKLYDSLNAVNLGYYDYYGNDIAVAYSDNGDSNSTPIYNTEPEEPVNPKPDIPDMTKKKTFIIKKVWDDSGHESERPSEISAELKVANTTLAKVELNEYTTPPWTNEVTFKMPENVDIDADWDEVSGRGLFDLYTMDSFIDGTTTTFTNTYKGDGGDDSGGDDPGGGGDDQGGDSGGDDSGEGGEYIPGDFIGDRFLIQKLKRCLPTDGDYHTAPTYKEEQFDEIQLVAAREETRNYTLPDLNNPGTSINYQGVIGEGSFVGAVVLPKVVGRLRDDGFFLEFEDETKMFFKPVYCDACDFVTIDVPKGFMTKAERDLIWNDFNYKNYIMRYTQARSCNKEAGGGSFALGWASGGINNPNYNEMLYPDSTSYWSKQTIHDALSMTTEVPYTGRLWMLWRGDEGESQITVQLRNNMSNKVLCVFTNSIPHTYTYGTGQYDEHGDEIMETTTEYEIDEEFEITGCVDPISLYIKFNGSRLSYTSYVKPVSGGFVYDPCSNQEYNNYVQMPHRTEEIGSSN